MPEQAADRLDVLKRIEEYEKKCLFDLDTEINPPSSPLAPGEVDFLNKKLFSRIKTVIANFLGDSYFKYQLIRGNAVLKEVIGLENLTDQQGGAIVTCNHFSVFDNYAVYMVLKKHFKRYTLHKFIREGNYALPGLFGFLMRHCNTLPLCKDPALMKECARAAETLLKRGQKLLIYPEEGMWWNYRKPRPLKKGAFWFAARNNVPVIPCFITMQDGERMGKDGFWVQAHTFHIAPLIYPDPALTVNENCKQMRDQNFEIWKNIYETTYKMPLRYLEADQDDTDEDDLCALT